MKPLSPFRRAMLAARKIPNPPAKNRAERVRVWAEFVKQAIRDEDKAAQKELKK